MWLQYSHHCPCTSAKVSCTHGRLGPRPARRSPAAVSPWQRNLRFHCSRANWWRWSSTSCKDPQFKWKHRKGVAMSTIIKVTRDPRTYQILNSPFLSDQVLTEEEIPVCSRKRLLVVAVSPASQMVMKHNEGILIPVTFSDTFISCYVVPSVKMNQHLGCCFLKYENNTSTYEFETGSINMSFSSVSSPFLWGRRSGPNDVQSGLCIAR